MSTQAGNRVNLSMSVSADGFVAGPNQDEDNPLGVGGIELHRWHIDEGPESGGHPVNKQVMSEMMDGMGAWILGRNMFGPIRGPWPDEEWKGWWGPNPPYHVPTFVLTHHARGSVEMEGGTSFPLRHRRHPVRATSRRRRSPAARISPSAAAPHAPSRPSRPGWSTRSTSRCPR